MPQLGAKKFYASFTDLHTWLEQMGFIVQHRQINSMLHSILATKA
jgi:hypothetical protein